MKLAILFFILLLHSFILQAQIIPTIPLLTVTGEAVYNAVPDHSIISVRVQRRIDIANISGVTDAFLFSKENTDIKFFGANDQDILATIPEIDIRDSKNAVVFVKEFIITVKNMNDLPKIVMELLRHDFTNIYSISYRVSNINESKNNARKLAIANARAAAELYAHELGQVIGKAHLVTEEETPIVNWYQDKYNPNLREIVSTTYRFNPGYITIPCKVTVGFELR